MKRSFPYKHIRTFDDIPMLMCYEQGHMQIETAHFPRIDTWYEGDASHKIFTAV